MVEDGANALANFFKESAGNAAREGTNRALAQQKDSATTYKRAQAGDAAKNKAADTAAETRAGDKFIKAGAEAGADLAAKDTHDKHKANIDGQGRGAEKAQGDSKAGSQNKAAQNQGTKASQQSLQAKMFKQSNPTQKEVINESKKLPNYNSLLPKQQQQVQRFMKMHMMKQKLQQMQQQAKAEGNTKEEAVLKDMVAKLKIKMGEAKSDMDPKTKDVADAADEAEGTEGEEEVEGAEEAEEAGKPKTETENAVEGTKGDTDSGEGGDSNLTEGGDVIPATLTPLAAESMTEAMESGEFGEVISTGGEPSADGELSLKSTMLGSLTGGKNPVHVAQDSQGNCHLYRVRPPSERKRHPLADIPLKPGQKDGKITRSQNEILPGEHFRVGAKVVDGKLVGGRLYNIHQLERQAKEFAKAHPGQDTSHIVLGDRRIAIEDVTPGQAEKMGIPSITVSKEDLASARTIYRETGIIRGYQLAAPASVIRSGFLATGHAPVTYI